MEGQGHGNSGGAGLDTKKFADLKKKQKRGNKKFFFLLGLGIPIYKKKREEKKPPTHTQGKGPFSNEKTRYGRFTFSGDPSEPGYGGTSPVNSAI